MFLPWKKYKAGTKDEFLPQLIYHSLPHEDALIPSNHFGHTGSDNAAVATCATVSEVLTRGDRMAQPVTRQVVSHQVPGHCLEILGD